MKQMKHMIETHLMNDSAEEHKMRNNCSQQSTQ